MLSRSVLSRGLMAHSRSVFGVTANRFASASAENFTALGEDGVPTHFAVVQCSGHQFRVVPGDVIVVNNIEGPDVGDQIRLPKVLMVGSQEYTAVGQPLVHNSYVLASVEEHSLGSKVEIYKFRRRKNYQRHRGHRQQLTTLRIDDIKFDKDANDVVVHADIDEDKLKADLPGFMAEFMKNAATRGQREPEE